ncbi:F0F1 ATP synthase subunit B [Candidatus Uhrbacteria bacterium]|nr:F0F1 ATP synthase subunit B [Candidatus Uhrbacteria bacterium]
MSTPTNEATTIAAEGVAETSTEIAATEEAAGGPAAVIGTFGLNGGMFVAQLVNFLLVLFVLWKFAYKPVLRMLEEREAKIAKSVADAEAVEARVREFEVEREALLAAARKEAQEIVTAAVAQSETRKEEMIDAAKREVERVIAKGKQQLIIDKESMLREVRKDMVDIAVKAAARILHTGVDEGKSKSLAEEVVRKMT